MMAIVNRESRFTLLDRQTGEGMSKQEIQNEKDRRWRETWRDGEANEGSGPGQEADSQPTEDRQGQPGRPGTAQGTEEEVT
jgi:hypothetical protein